jgi:hypothetical protein
LARYDGRQAGLFSEDLLGYGHSHKTPCYQTLQ